MSGVETTGYWCPDCEVVTEPVRIYECDTDGWTGTESQCAECKKFVSSRGDGCEDCFAELVETDVVVDHDGTVIRWSDYEPNGKSLADRRKQSAASQAKKADADHEKKVKAFLAQSHEKQWSEVKVGDHIVVKDWKGKLDLTRDATVVSLTTVGSECDSRLTPGSFVAVLEQYGLRVKAFLPTDVALMRNDATPAVTPTAEERFILRHGSDTHGSSIKLISSGIGLSTFSDEPVYLGEIIGSTSKYSSAQTAIAAFAQPEEAVAFAKTARAAAEELRQMRLFDSAEVEVSSIEDFVPIAHAPVRYACFTVGADDFTQEFGVSVRVGGNPVSGHTFCVSDAAVLDAIAKAAEDISHGLAGLLGVKS